MKVLNTSLSRTEMKSKLLEVNSLTQSWWWRSLFAVSLALTLIFFFGIWKLFTEGVGIWGINRQVNWAFAITNFVWWVGIGHAGTFISAFLLMSRQKWRASINRSAEAMTLIAIACAGLFPILHLGRPLLFFWVIPYPTNFGMWPQLRSSLVWDVLAITSYIILSLVFWYIGLLPDLRSLYEKSKKLSQPLRSSIYRVLSLGWVGDSLQWKLHSQTSMFLAALGIALVVSVHSIVSLDFAIGVEPGWHSTIFPPFFVTGAIFSGFAMVLTLLIPMRHWLKLEGLITCYHLNCIRKLLVVSGLMVAYGYIVEHFFIWYSGHSGELNMQAQRAFGDQAWIYWLMLILNLGLPLIYSRLNAERHLKWMFVLSLLVNVGMWIERYVIVVLSVSADFLPASWMNFKATIYDWIFLFGSIGFFFLLFLLFLRFLPPVSIWEMEELQSESHQR